MVVIVCQLIPFIYIFRENVLIGELILNSFVIDHLRFYINLVRLVNSDFFFPFTSFNVFILEGLHRCLVVLVVKN